MSEDFSHSYLEINAPWITNPLAHEVENCIGDKNLLPGNGN